MSAPESPKAVFRCCIMMRSGKKCGREAYDEEGNCVCHSEAPGRTLAFKTAVQEILASGDLDFGGFVFPKYTSLGNREFASNANFAWALFEGEARFGGATFEGAVSFERVEFRGGADFSGATFQERADLSTAGFQGRADFGGAAFQDEVSFRGAVFQGEALFRGAEFQDNTDFYDARFHARADFWMTEFPNECPDRKTAGVSFERVTLDRPEKAVFCHVFLGRARFRGTDMRHVDFTDVEWDRRPFWGPRWRAIVDRDGRLGRAIRWTCKKWPAWARPRGRFALWDELGPDDQGSKQDYALIGKLYRQLKSNLEEQRDPIPAGDFHFGEMHLRRLSNPPRNPVLRFLKRNLSFLALYRWISGYGEDYALALAWIMIMVLGFAAAFAWVPALALHASPPSATSQPVHGFWPHVVYSVMCLLFRGEKPFTPVHFGGQCASVVEGVIGLPLIAMFVLALNRRFKR